MRVWAGTAVFAVVALVLASGIVLAWYVAHRLHNSAASTAGLPVATSTTMDAKQAAAAKLKEADELINAGRADEATARLREVAALDPADAEPHRRLAGLLSEGGARRMAITELQTVVRLAPDDAQAWRDLATAQSAEGDYAAAAESYHALFGLANDASADDRLQLAYADALRLSGRAGEAQSIYKRLSNSRVAEVSRASRQQLGNANANESKNENEAKGTSANSNLNSNHSSIPALADSSNSTPHAAESQHTQDSNSNPAQARPAPATLPADASTQDHFERGVQLWRTNRGAALVELGAAAQRGNTDADYYLGLNLAEGRDPHALKRGELVAALNYFQRARHSHFSGEARRYEDALVKEYDRRRSGNDNEER
jgi:tetratricopeptide (TPR) repeat protein